MQLAVVELGLMGRHLLLEAHPVVVALVHLMVQVRQGFLGKAILAEQGIQTV